MRGSVYARGECLNPFAGYPFAGLDCALSEDDRARDLRLLACTLVVGCAIRGANDLPVTDDFTAAGCVDIVGYDGDAMEPFIVPEYRRSVVQQPQLAARTDRSALGAQNRRRSIRISSDPIKGVNSPALDGVPSVDESGTMYFMSTRSYDETFATIYRGHWSNGYGHKSNWYPALRAWPRVCSNFDAEISRDGDSLFYAKAASAAAPIRIRLTLPSRIEWAIGSFATRSATCCCRRVNTPALEYAPAVSADRRELFFTRLDRHARTIAIYRVKRIGAGQEFGPRGTYRSR